MMSAPGTLAVRMAQTCLPGLGRSFHHLRRDDGVAAVEFAIVGLVFFAVLLGSIELGRALWMKNSVQFAAEEAARWALVQETENTAGVIKRAQEQLMSSAVPAVITAPYVTDGGVRYVVVTVTQVFTPVTALVSTSIITLSGQARLPIGWK